MTAWPVLFFCQKLQLSPKPIADRQFDRRGLTTRRGQTHRGRAGPRPVRPATEGRKTSGRKLSEDAARLGREAGTSREPPRLRGERGRPQKGRG
jgi:hypothetical protein